MPTLCQMISRCTACLLRRCAAGVDDQVAVALEDDAVTRVTVGFRIPEWTRNCNRRVDHEVAVGLEGKESIRVTPRIRVPERVRGIPHGSSCVDQEVAVGWEGEDRCGAARD